MPFMCSTAPLIRIDQLVDFELLSGGMCDEILERHGGRREHISSDILWLHRRRLVTRNARAQEIITTFGKPRSSRS